MRRTLIALSLLALPALAHAGPAEVAAALQGEAAECRYLLQQCARVNKLDAAAEVDGLGGVKPDDVIRAILDTNAAARVIRAKHEKPPKCFRECVDRNGDRLLATDVLE